MMYTFLMMIGCQGADQNIVIILPDMAIPDESVEFGEVIVQETEQRTLQIINAGQATLRIQNIDISDNDGFYTLSDETLEILSDEMKELTITFTPPDYGEYNRELTIISNDEENPTFKIPVNAEGGDGPQPDIVLSQTMLDFGDTAVGEEKMLHLLIENQGDADLLVGYTTQTGSGAFAITGDVDNAILSPNVSTGMLVTYTPIQPNGDSGSLIIPSNDPYEPSVEILFQGNGGGELAYPEAIIDCPSEVTPPSEINLLGSDSFDPSGEAITFSWELMEKPIGSTAELGSTANSTSVLPVDVAGTYHVNLTVTNESNVSSAPAECIFYAEPPADIHVELSWTDEEADLDLHLLRQADGFFTLSDDCCWCNRTPDWGSSGDAENPVLSMDSEDNSTPEIIDYPTAPEGEYYVRTHYFSDRGAGQTQATIRIYISGVLEGYYTKNLIHNQVWDVGFIRWSLGYLIDEDGDPYNYEGPRSCQ